MHLGFKEEPKELLGEEYYGKGGLPKVFIEKKYVGGVEEIQKLHNDKKLEKLLDCCERIDDIEGGDGGCEACSDIKFVPYQTCYGSCKIYYEGDYEEDDNCEDLPSQGTNFLLPWVLWKGKQRSAYAEKINQYTMGAYLTKEQRISVNLFIDEEKNKVLFVQAGKDFMDVLLSFLTLPMGTIARLVSKNSNIQKVRVGSISSLYDSVVNLDEKQFWTPVCKEMLLRPRNAMEEYCQHMKLNIDDTEKIKYFVCEDRDCSRRSRALLSTFRNQRCMCGKPMNREIFHESSSTDRNVDYDGFVPETASFIISDDLSVKPDTCHGTIFKHLNLPESCDLDAIKQVTVNVTLKEILDLLKCSLFSLTPLTDVFLRKSLVTENRQAQPISSFDSSTGDLKAKSKVGKITVKLLVRKSSNKILFALGGEDFTDLIVSLLTFPLGGVEHMLNGKSYMGSIDNLYKSVLVLDQSNYLTSPNLMDKLVNSTLAHQFKIRNQMLPIDEASAVNYSCYSKKDIYGAVSSSLVPSSGGSWSFFDTCIDLDYLEPQSSTGEAYNRYGGRGFTKKPSLYMVTDDLVVTLGSSTSAISVLTKLRIPLSDVVERSISIGKNECLSIVKASLTSSCALTNGLGSFLTKST